MKLTPEQVARLETLVVDAAASDPALERMMRGIVEEKLGKQQDVELAKTA